MDERFLRTEKLLGSNEFDKLKTAKVLVVGVGGVGGYAVEMLARAGIGNLTLVDGDVVEITNINRQIIALSSTIGKFKVDVFKTRILDINPNCDVKIINYRYNANTSEVILNDNFDYVIDAIDSLKDKVHLIKTCKAKNLNIISAMGAGNRYELCEFSVTDVFKTTHDGLAKKLRKLLRDEGIENLEVVSTSAEPKKSDGVVGSICFLPPLSGITIAGYIINKLIRRK